MIRIAKHWRTFPPSDLPLDYHKTSMYMWISSGAMRNFQFIPAGKDPSGKHTSNSVCSAHYG